MLLHIISVFLLSSVTVVKLQHAPQLTLNQLNHELEAEFKVWDTDNNGTVDFVEFKTQVLHQDVDNDGCVSFREFIRVRSQDPIRFVFLVFDLLDQDKDGCLMIKDEMNEFYTIDNNPTDLQITIQELETYYDKFYERVFPLLGYQTIAP